MMVRNMATGVVQAVDNDEAEYKQLSWTEEGNGLAVLKGTNHDDFEEKLYTVVGVHRFEAKKPEKVVCEPLEDEAFPENMTISPNCTPRWTEDFSGLLFGIHEESPHPNGSKKGFPIWIMRIILKSGRKKSKRK